MFRPMLSGPHFLSPFALGLRRRHLRFIRRLGCAGLSLAIILGMVLQQSHADYWIANGLPARDFVAAYPSWLAIASDSVTRFARSHLPKQRRALQGGLELVPGVEDSAGAPRRWEAGEPVGPFSVVNLATGNVFTHVPIVFWDDVAFSLFHSSIGAPGNAAMSPGWSHSYSARLNVEDVEDNVELFTDDGTRVPFGSATPATLPVHRPNYRLTLKKSVDGAAYLVVDSAQNVMSFDADSGRLLSVADASGNEVKLTYDGDHLRFITDPVKRELTLNYGANGQLESIDAPSLTSGTQELARRFELGYSSGLLEKIHSPRREPAGDLGEPPLFHIALTYEGAGPQLKTIADYEGNATRFRYHAGTPRRLARVDSPSVHDFEAGRSVVARRSYVYETFSAETTVTDERGGVTVYDFDASYRLQEITDPLGRVVSNLVWKSAPETGHQLDSVTNVLGLATDLEYDGSGNVSGTRSSIGGVLRESLAEFDSLNNLLAATDPLGQITSYQYNDPSNPTRVTEIYGPGAAPLSANRFGAPSVATLNQLSFDWGSESAGNNGLLQGMTSPNKGTQRFQQARRAPSRSMSGDEDEDGCDDVRSTVVTSATGEPSVVGREVNCPDFIAVLVRPEQQEGRYGPEPTEAATAGGSAETCLQDTPVGTCGDICGCEREYDEAGSVVNLGETFESGSCGASGALQATLRGGVAGAANQMFRYDGNQRLIAAKDPYINRRSVPGADVTYQIKYDGRGRLTEWVSEVAYEAADNGPSPYAHVSLSPRYSVRHEYSDSTGKFATIYHRDSAVARHGQTAPPNYHENRDIRTVYQTDAAGRITSVNRDGRETKYIYRDSTVLPAVEEFRPDGSSTKIYVNSDGSTKRIAHTDSHGIVLSDYSYTRDAAGRIIHVDQTIKDEFAQGGCREETLDYVYGDGNLLPSELDDPKSHGQTVPNADKLYYRFIEDLGPQCEGGLRGALCDGDPNRLVSERLSVVDAADLTLRAVEYERDYRYDQGGNRLVLRERDPRGGAVRSVTRYNYSYPSLARGGEVSQLLPGTPLRHGEAVMDYAGKGRDRLLSTQTFYPDEPTRVDVTVFGYENDKTTSAANIDHITYRETTTWTAETFDWLKRSATVTHYDYFMGQLERVTTDRYDFCPGGACECPLTNPATCSAPCCPKRYQRQEFNVYDVFGRRVARMECDRPCFHFAVTNNYDGFCDPTDTVGLEFKGCEFDELHYDYDGLSHTVLAERYSPYIEDVEDERQYEFVGDRFISTYLHGPLGVISRTAENGNADTADNKTQYYLADAQRGHVGVMHDADESPATPTTLVMQVYDAFGVAMGKAGGTAGSLAWRGGEGSVTDREPGLVYMQARHYDPSLGRFLQSDALPLASLTTQGTNRFIYCENDPVNRSDPTGAHLILAIGALLLAGGIYFLKALAKSKALRHLLKKIENKAVRCFLEEALDYLTGMGPLGWLGVSLIAAGWFFTLWTLGFGAPLGGLVAGVGALLYGIDYTIGAVTDWAVDSVLDWLLALEHMRDTEAEWKRRPTQMPSFTSGFG